MVFNCNKDIARVVTLNQNDVICGRGMLALKHPGNIAHRQLVRENKVLYASCIRQDKIGISKKIVALIRDLNGRFLVRKDGLTSSLKDVNGNPATWSDIGDEKAIEKTSQALREKSYKRIPKKDVVVNHMALFNSIGVVHQHQIISRIQFSPVQTLEQNTASQLQLQSAAHIQMCGLEPPDQNTFLPQQHQNTTYSQNSSGENSVDPTSQSTYLWQEPQGSRNHQLWCMPVTERIDERNNSGASNSRISIGSYVEDDPVPLPFPYHVGEYNNAYEYEQHQNATQNSSDENNIDPMSQSTEIMSQESWGLQNSPPYCKPAMVRICERNNSRTSNFGISNCSRTEEDITPLPYHVGADDDTNEHIFSTYDCQQLTSALSLDGQPQGKSGSPCLHQATIEQILAEIEKRLGAKEGAKVKEDDNDCVDFKHF